MRRRDLLTAALASGGLGLCGSRVWTGGPQRSLVVVLASGGWDPTFVMDPKLGLPGHEGPEWDEDPEDVLDVNDVQTISGIPVVVNARRRPAVTGFFERWGTLATVVNGLRVGTIAHPNSLARVLTGSVEAGRPDLASVVGSWGHAPVGSIDLTGHSKFGPYGSHSLRWGRQSQAVGLVDSQQPFPRPVEDGLPFEPTLDERAAAAEVARARAGRLGARWPDALEALAQWSESGIAGQELQEGGSSAMRGLPWGRAANAFGDVDLVVSLLSRGLTRSVTVSTRQRWDTHTEHGAQHRSFDQTFGALDRLLEGLQGEGLLASTTVLVLSELARTPGRNGEGGKDHWPWTSAMVLGGGLPGGRVLGATDDRLQALRVDLKTGAPDPNGAWLEPGNLLAGVAESLDVDPRQWWSDSVPLTLR